MGGAERRRTSSSGAARQGRGCDRVDRAASAATLEGALECKGPRRAAAARCEFRRECGRGRMLPRGIDPAAYGLASSVDGGDDADVR